MGPDFDGDPGPPNTPERFRHPSFGSPNLTFPKNFTLVTQQAVATGLVSQIIPIVTDCRARLAFTAGFGFCR